MEVPLVLIPIVVWWVDTTTITPRIRKLTAIKSVQPITHLMQDITPTVKLQQIGAILTAIPMLIHWQVWVVDTVLDWVVEAMVLVWAVASLLTLEVVDESVKN